MNFNIELKKTNFISLLFVKQHCAHFCKYIVDDCVPADLWENKINYKNCIFIFAERIIAGQ